MAIATKSGLIVRSIDEPDERREPSLTRVDVINLGEHTIAHDVFQPGWRWSTNIKPVVGTDSCQVEHTGYVIKGRIHVRLNDGTEQDLGPGDAVHIPAGHDAWVLGDEPCEMLEVSTPAAKSYAVPSQR